MLIRGIMLLAVITAWPALALAEIKLQIIATDPLPPAVLGRWEHYSVLVSYDTDRPFYLRGDVFLGGRRVTSITGGSWRLEPGTGETIFWFAYTEPAQVDQVVVWAEDAQTRAAMAQTRIDVALRWTGVPPGAARPRPEWVERLMAVQEARSEAEYQAYMNRPRPWWQWGIFFAMIWSAPGYLVAQVLALWRLRGGWRLAAAIPTVPMALVLGYTFVAYRAGSNLFPLVLIFTSPLALAYLVVVLLASRRARQPARGLPIRA